MTFVLETQLPAVETQDGSGHCRRGKKKKKPVSASVQAPRGRFSRRAGARVVPRGGALTRDRRCRPGTTRAGRVRGGVTLTRAGMGIWGLYAGMV